MLLRVLFALLLLPVPVALAAPVQLTGEVTYRERIALPEGAVLTIDMVDLAIPERPRLTVRAPIGGGQVPLIFTLTFEDSMILPLHHYVLNAEIRGPSFLFRNTEPYPVSPLGQTTPIQIVTSPITAETAPAPAAPQPTANLPIVGVTWTAKSIEGDPVPPQMEITLLVEPGHRIGGVGGCNSYFSQATIGEHSFMSGQIARTQRGCLGGRNAIEQIYLDALAAAQSWTIDNGALILLDSAGNQLVQFSS